MVGEDTGPRSGEAGAFEQVPEVRTVRHGDQAEWLRMRGLLWPGAADGEHAQEIAAYFRNQTFSWSESLPAVAVFVAVRPSGGLCGFLEASIRPFAEGCQTRPVGYIEGWFVDAEMRHRGIGRRLAATAEQWALAQGCHEMASDAHLENTLSRIAHKALGYEESSRAIRLRKRLTGANGNAPDRICAVRPQTLLVLEDTFAMCRLGSDASVPPWATAGGFFSITRTADELSVVCPQEGVPGGVTCERGWRCLRVAGTIPFATVGVLAALTAPLAEAGISVFAVSTFDTDYLLLKAQNLEGAIDVLRRQGHTVQSGAA